MADSTDPRNPPQPLGTDPRAPLETHIHATPPPPAEKRSNNSVLAFIVGGVVVGMVALYLLFGAERAPSPGASAPAESTTNINIESGAAASDDAASAPAETAPEAQQPAAGAEIEAAPAPLD